LNDKILPKKRRYFNRSRFLFIRSRSGRHHTQ